jgi:ABC-2 type transport system permease protein
VNRLVALTRREVLAYFYAPVPYLVMFLFLLMTWFMFVGPMSQPVVQITYVPVLEWLAFVLLFLMPLLTMNSVAEERSTNTLETLLTAPVSDWQVIFAKWFATFSFYAFMLLPTLVFWLVLHHIGGQIGQPHPGPIVAGYCGALLLGSLYVAIGIFASSLTENALLSAFLAFFATIGLLLLAMVAQVLDSLGLSVPVLNTVGEYISPQTHFMEFLKGRIDVFDLVYFVTATAFFLFLAVRSLESRKWR